MAEPQRVAFGGHEARGGEFPFDPAAVGQWFVGQNGRAGAVGEQTRADQNAGIVIEKKSRAADLDADGENFFCATGGENGFGGAQIWQRRAAALADEVERENIRTQAELFADVTREAGTQIAGAGADEDGVHFLRPAVGVFQRALRGLGGKRRRVPGEAGLQGVGRLVKNFGERVERKMPRVNAVVAAENFFEDGVRTRLEPGKLRPVV